MLFQRIWQYIQLAPKPQVTILAEGLHIQLLHLHLPGQLVRRLVCTTKEVLRKKSETVSGKLICRLVVFTGS